MGITTLKNNLPMSIKLSTYVHVLNPTNLTSGIDPRETLTHMYIFNEGLNVVASN